MQKILNLVLWYRCGLISEREFIKAINNIKGMEIPFKSTYEQGVYNVK